jgi:hypothetical protein
LNYFGTLKNVFWVSVPFKRCPSEFESAEKTPQPIIVREGKDDSKQKRTDNDYN